MGCGEVGIAMGTCDNARPRFARQLMVVVEPICRLWVIPAHHGTHQSARQAVHAGAGVRSGREGDGFTGRWPTVHTSCTPCRRTGNESRTVPHRGEGGLLARGVYRAMQAAGSVLDLPVWQIFSNQTYSPKRIKSGMAYHFLLSNQRL